MFFKHCFSTLTSQGGGGACCEIGTFVTILPTNLTYELFPAVQVGGSENVVSLERLQQKVVPDAGDTVRGVRGLRRAGRPEVGAETLVRLCSP